MEKQDLDQAAARVAFERYETSTIQFRNLMKLLGDKAPAARWLADGR